MMNHYGKILGAIVGWMILKHPLGVVLGLVLGHALDAGWLRGPQQPGTPAPPGPEQYDLLGVAPEASDDELHAAYRRRISEYHPDKVQNAAKEIRDLAEKRARAINQAYESILKLRKAQRPHD